MRVVDACCLPLWPMDAVLNAGHVSQLVSQKQLAIQLAGLEQDLHYSKAVSMQSGPQLGGVRSGVVQTLTGILKSHVTGWSASKSFRAPKNQQV